MIKAWEVRRLWVKAKNQKLEVLSNLEQLLSLITLGTV